MNTDLFSETSLSTSSRAVALSQQFNQRKCMLGLYGFLDGLDIASKTLVLFVPLLSTSTLKLWALTDEGFYLSLLFVSSLAIFSTLGNAFNGSKNNVEKTIFRLWQIMRDVIKGVKIAYKGIKNILALTPICSTYDFKPLLLTLSMPLILLFIFNRLVTRYLSNQRKNAQIKNKLRLKSLENLWQVYHLAPEGVLKNTAKQDYLAFVGDAKHKQLETLSQQAQYTLFASSFFETIMNGSYIFMGAAMLAPTSPQAMLFITCVSMAMMLINIISAWHETFEYQIKLQRTKQAFHVACALHDLELALNDLRIAPFNPMITQYALQSVEQKQLVFEKEKSKQDELYKSTYTEAFFIGLRYTVAAHKVIMGALGCMAMVSGLILGTTLTEAVVLACMSFSIVVGLVLCIYAFGEAHRQIPQQNQFIQNQRTAITNQINAIIINTNLPSVHERSMFAQHTKPILLPKRTLLKETEKARACFSGSKKPKHLCEFILLFQNKTEDDRAMGTGAKLLLLFSMICYCVLWWTKAHDKQYPHASNAREPDATPTCAT